MSWSPFAHSHIFPCATAARARARWISQLWLEAFTPLAQHCREHEPKTLMYEAAVDDMVRAGPAQSVAASSR